MLLKISSIYSFVYYDGCQVTNLSRQGLCAVSEMIEIWKTSKPLPLILTGDVRLGEGLMISFLIGVSDD